MCQATCARRAVRPSTRRAVAVCPSTSKSPARRSAPGRRWRGGCARRPGSCPANRTDRRGVGVGVEKGACGVGRGDAAPPERSGDQRVAGGGNQFVGWGYGGRLKPGEGHKTCILSATTMQPTSCPSATASLKRALYDTAKRRSPRPAPDRARG